MSQGFPETRYEMKRAFYEFKGRSTCKSCGEPIEWWKTTKGKNMPIDASENEASQDDKITPHWATCPKADAHRQPAAAQPATNRRALTLEEEQMKALDLLAAQLKARALVAIMPDSTYRYIVKNGIPAEDLRHDLITAANCMKRDLEVQR